MTNTDPDGRDRHLYGIDGVYQGDISDEAFDKWCRQVQCTVSASGAIYDQTGSLLGREVWFDDKRAEELNNTVGFMNWFMLNHSLEILTAGAGSLLTDIGSSAFLRLGIQSGRVGTAVEGAAQLTKFTGTLDRIIQTSKGPIRVYAQITMEGDTALVSDLAIYPANSEQAVDVGFTGMRQGLRAIQNELKESGYSAMRVDNAYRVGGMGSGRTTTFTVKLK